MAQEELETQVRNWIQKEEFEKIEYFVLDTILEHHLQKQENKQLSDIEDWERIRGLLLHEDNENQVLGLQLLEGVIILNIDVYKLIEEIQNQRFKLIAESLKYWLLMQKQKKELLDNAHSLQIEILQLRNQIRNNINVENLTSKLDVKIKDKEIIGKMLSRMPYIHSPEHVAFGNREKKLMNDLKKVIFDWLD